VASGAPPALLLTESGAGGAPSACAAATSVGDTHMFTFDGLLYDYQATGDYLLVQADDGFIVQARQVSGAPSWPNAATNTAVATQMGKSRVAICANPSQVLLDGRSSEVGDGQTISLPGGADVSRSGNVYTVTDQGGDSVRATVNDNGANRWIDVAVGLGHTPQAHLSGLLANALDDPRAIVARSGAVFPLPVSFLDLYGVYGVSWRVPRNESILCGEPVVDFASPSEVFYARNLPPALARPARQVCREAGVRNRALLDACTLDVAVLGDKTAANVYVHATPPAVVMPAPGSGQGEHDDDDEVHEGADHHGNGDH
jgi:hypothetical protein